MAVLSGSPARSNTMTKLDFEFAHSDERRTITQLFTGSISQVNVYEAASGAVLGNHYHKRTTEFFYILSGRALYNGQEPLESGDLFVVYPEERHTITCQTDLKLMTFLTKPYSQDEPDIYK